jgi:hypothetical protein
MQYKYNSIILSPASKPKADCPFERCQKKAAVGHTQGGERGVLGSTWERREKRERAAVGCEGTKKLVPDP